jgi:hypothetical protein
MGTPGCEQRRGLLSALLVAGLTGIALAGGCGLREAICPSGEHAVAAVRSTTGRACVPDGQAPPAGYVDFPPDKIPQHVDDEWDRYWAEHRLDENSHELTG